MMMKMIISNIVIIFGISAALFVCVAESRQPAATSITCNTVEVDAMPCLPYAEGNQNTVPQTCCDGLKNLVASASTADDKKTACNCLSEAFQKFPSIKDDALQKIPGLCNVVVPFPLSKNLKCNNITQFSIAF